MAKLISRAEFARRCDVSKPAISKACGKQLAPACVADRIDVDHEAARAYMASRGVKLGAVVTSAGAPTKRSKQAKASSPKPTPVGRKRSDRAEAADGNGPRGDGAKPDAGSDVDLEQLAATLHPLIDRFGTEQTFKDWLAALKDIEAIREKRLKNAETEGRLISRDLVKTHIFGTIEAANKRLLSDSAKTIASEVFNLARSGGSLEEGERLVRETIGSQLKPVKTSAARNLRRGLNGKAQSDS